MTIELQFKPVPPDKHRMNLSEPDDSHRYYVWREPVDNGKWLAHRYVRNGATWIADSLGRHATLARAMQKCDDDYTNRSA